MSNVCFKDSLQSFTVAKCYWSDTYYVNWGTAVTRLCPNDKRRYQACVNAHQNDLDTDISRPFCDQKVLRTFSKYRFNYYFSTDRLGVVSKFNSKIAYYTLQTGFDPTRTCNGYCGLLACDDEQFCNGVQYGTHCKITKANRTFSIYTGSKYICDGYQQCQLGEDETDCTNDHDQPEDMIVLSSINEVKKSGFCFWKLDDDSRSEYDGISNNHRYRLYEGHVYRSINDTDRCSSLRYDDHNYKKRFKNLQVKNMAQFSNTPFNPLCLFYLDQTNCTDPHRVGVSCTINGFHSTVSRLATCAQNPGLCDDGFDTVCVATSIGCFVHKHLLCDGTPDCLDGTDETASICQTMTKSKCYRRYHHKNAVAIPLAWLEDGLEDCKNGDDERRIIWPTCGKGEYTHFVKDNVSTSCQEVYVCNPGASHKFVKLEDLCNGDDKCGHMKMCSREGSTELEVYSTNPTRLGTEKLLDMVGYCLKGVQKSLGHHIAPCVEENFNPGNIFGVGSVSSVMIPNTVVDCQSLFGKAYIYMSCSGKCVDQPQCPFKPPMYDGCTFENKFPDRKFSIFEMNEINQLTFVYKNKESRMYENRMFQCRNDRCIDFKHVCNLVDDCGDGSDETVCSNNFVCDEPRRFIARSQKCNGRIDCNDHSDECNDDCGRQIIPGTSLELFSWFVGLVAVVLNSVKLFKNIKILVARGYTNALNDKVLTTVLHLGDLLTGFYLLTIAIVDSIVYGSSYCVHRFRWLSSNTCAFLGILSTFGAQISLLTMTCLSIFRAIGSTKIQMYTSKHGALKMFTIVVIIIIISFFIAYTPLIDRYEDYFVDGMTYMNSEIKIFPSMVTKEIHLDLIKKHYGRIRINSDMSWSWRKIIQLIDGMFSRQYGGLGRRKIHFYGNDGVCLFKYFVSKEDTQKAYVWGSLLWNVSCFLIIFICYIKVMFFSKKFERKRAIRKPPRPNQVEIDPNEDTLETQQYIAAVILTDFVCWIPFVILCSLHFFEVMDAKPLYSVSSIVLLPINSLINPVLYNNFLVSTIKGVLNRARHWLISLSTNSDDQSHVQSENAPARGSGIELRPISNMNECQDSETVAARGTDIELKPISNTNECQDNETATKRGSGIELKPISNMNECQDSETATTGIELTQK